MRSESALLLRKAKPLHSLVDAASEGRNVRRSFHARPEHTRPLFIGEEAKSAEVQFHGLRGANRDERRSHLSELRFVGFSKKFQRDMQILGAHPSRRWCKRAQLVHQCCECESNLAGYLNRNKQAHANPLSPVGGRARAVEIMHADHVESELRSVEPYTFAVAWKMHEPLLNSRGRCQGQMDRTDGLFFTAAPGTGDACDTDTERAPDTPPDTFGQRDRHFTAHGALRSNHFGGHIGPRRFQFVAKADGATEKVGRAARNTGQSFGE